MRLYFLRRRDGLAALEDIVRQGLFHVHVLAGLTGPDRHQGMPMVGRGGGDGVDVLALQQLADIRVAFDRLAQLGGLRHTPFENSAVGVAQGHHADPGQLPQQPEMQPALTAKSDHRQAEVIVCAQDLGSAVPRRLRRRRRAWTFSGTSGG